jgi:glycosyltransferase involved in cell wall biosynthesis
MRIAFYAPMKPPSGARPSGDRNMARLLIRALTEAGHEVTLASHFRSRDGAGEAASQAAIERRGGAAARRLVERYQAASPALQPEAWFTYHLYHKAPDWLGPAVADALAIPYIVAEASFAPKQSAGRWAHGHAATEWQIRRADAVIGLNSNDSAQVRPLLRPDVALTSLRPFLDPQPFAAACVRRAAHRARLAKKLGLEPDVPLLLAVGMMRTGDKLASYRVLGGALATLGDVGWQILIVGDGPARPEVEAAFAALGKRVRFSGRIEAVRLPAVYAASDLYVWPAVREAYGMAILEAQAAGLACVAGRAGGVGDIVREGETGLLSPEGDADAFARDLRALLADPARRTAMGEAARATVAREHTVAVAAAVLDAAIARAVKVASLSPVGAAP